MRSIARLVSFLVYSALALPLFAGFQSTETYLVAVGRAPGQLGAQIYSTVWATNLTGVQNSFTVYFLKQGQANTSPASFSDTLAPGETKIYENIVESKFGLSGVIGAARIVSAGEILVSERIYNQPSGADLGNTEGFFFAGVPKGFSISSGQSASIQGVNQGGSENFRSNFILVETGGASTTVNVQVFDNSGMQLGQKSYPLQAYEQFQANVGDIVPSIATTNGRITATVTGGTGSVLLAGAQVANETQDASGFEMSFRDSLLGTSGGTAGVTSLNGLTGALALTPGSGISITPSGGSINIAFTGGGSSGLTSVTHDASLTGAGTGASPLAIANGQVVRSLTVGASTLHDAVTLAAGSNVTLTPSGSTITIAATGGGGGGLSAVAHDSTLQGDGTSGTPLGVAVPLSLSAATGAVAITGSASGTGFGIHGHGAQNNITTDGYIGTNFEGVRGFGEGPGAEGVTGENVDSGNYGILGEPCCGVEGHANNSGPGLGIGVYGLNEISGNYGELGTGSAGVFGYAKGGASPGVRGEHDDSAGDFAGVEGKDDSSGHIGYLGGDVYGVLSHGDIVTDGAKDFVEPHPTDPSKQILYVCLEGPESGTYFRGTGKILNGFATIEIPDHFRMVTAEKGLTVVVTPIGAPAVLYCVKKGLDRIVIQGSSDVEFDYVVNGVRKAFEDHQPIVENTFFIPRAADDSKYWKSLPAESLRRLKANGTLNEDGTINLETAHRLGWDKRPGWRETAPETDRVAATPK